MRFCPSRGWSEPADTAQDGRRIATDLHRLEFQGSVAGGRVGATMQGSAVPRAVAAAKSTASSLGLTADEAIVLHDSNKLTLRLLPVGW